MNWMRSFGGGGPLTGQTAQEMDTWVTNTKKIQE